MKGPKGRLVGKDSSRSRTTGKWGALDKTELFSLRQHQFFQPEGPCPAAIDHRSGGRRTSSGTAWEDPASPVQWAVPQTKGGDGGSFGRIHLRRERPH